MLERSHRFDGVNDPYVAERLHAVVYGCCLISDDHGAIGRIADKTYARVFAGATPPAHILLRDYARGVVERALSLGCSLPHIDMNKVRPPYTSPWPLRAPTAETLAARYGGEDYSDLRMSLFPDAIGDFNRYVIEPSVLDFLATNQRKRAAVAHRQAESAALDAWRQFVDALAEDQRRRLEEKDWEGFFDSLSEAQRGCLNDARSAERERRTPREVRFDSQLVARWVFARVMDLGWRPERFAEFDHSIAASNSRTDHGAERIGKKYQWIALHEALARVADHCVYKPLWSSEASHASHAYEGPWQLGRRDIDPSLLPAPRPRADHAEASPQAWWVQASAQFPQPCADNARRAWVLEQSDLPDPSRLIDVTDPTKHRWLAVEGFYEWEEDVPVEVPRSSADRCVLWCRVSGYIVRRADLSPLLRWLGERKSTEWCMPENTSLSRVFLGEHGWHPSSREVDQGWVTAYTAPDAPAPVLIPSASYSWESGGYDRSLEKTVTAYVPSLPLLSSLRLQWQGEDFRYGHHRRAPALACDPGVSGEGPRALLVDRQALCEWLERERLALLWTVKAEKQVRTEHTPVVHAMYGTYLLDGDRIRRAAFTTELFGLSQGVGSGRRE